MTKKADVKLIFELTVEVEGEDFDTDDPRKWALQTANYFRQKAAIVIFEKDSNGDLQEITVDDQIFDPDKVDVRLARIYDE